MHIVTFEKVKNDHDRLRDDSIEGWCAELPTEGKPFIMTAPPRDMGDGRLVTTNIVTEVEEEGGIYTFKTASGSIYRVTRN